MKKRILSFVLMLVMLFSCLSLELFAAGNDGTEATARQSEAAVSDTSTEIIAEYFQKHGTIGKSGGYNLTAEQLEKKVDSSKILTNSDIGAWTKYSNTMTKDGKSTTITGTTVSFMNQWEIERIVPAALNGNECLLWNERPVARKTADGMPYSLELNEDGVTYADAELQALVEAGTVEVRDGVPYRMTSLSGEYVQHLNKAALQLKETNVGTLANTGKTFTLAITIANIPGVEGYGNFEIFSSTDYDSKKGVGFESEQIGYSFKIDSEGNLYVLESPASKDFVSTGYQFEEGAWAQLALTYAPRGVDGDRDVDESTGKIIKDSDDNTLYVYVNGELVHTCTGISSPKVWQTTHATTGEAMTINSASDYTCHGWRFGQASYGLYADNFRFYFDQNVEIATVAHANLSYSHRHDLENNKNILVATCQDEGCGATEELEIDLCDKEGEYGFSASELQQLLEASGRKGSTLVDFTGGKFGKLTFNNGTYKENEVAVIDWSQIVVCEDSAGNEHLLWQRPVAKNPATNELFTEAEVEALSDTAKALIVFDDGVPYYTGALTGEFVQFKYDEGAEATFKEMVLTDPENPVIGGTYAVTFDFTYYGGAHTFSLQIRSYSGNNGNTPFQSTSVYPMKIDEGKLYALDRLSSKEVPGVTIPVGETVQITFLHTPRGFDGERDVVDGYSVGDDNTYHIFINGELVATRNLYPSTSSYKEWSGEVGGEQVNLSFGSDFTPQFIRFGQVNADNANTVDLFAVDNLKIYRGQFLECAHSVSDQLDTCDWCGYKFDLGRCDLCQGRLLHEDVVLVGQSATVGDVIEFNAFLKLMKDPSLFGNETVILDTTANGGTRKMEYKVSDLAMIKSGEAKGLYKVSLPLRSIDMAREITISGGSADGYIGSATACLSTYLDQLLDTTNSYYVRQLLKSMENYGAYAQEYFEGKNGNPEDLGTLPNASLTELDKNQISGVSMDTLAPYKASIEGSAVEISSFKLVLDSATELRILFRDGEGVTVTENGKALAKHASEIDGYSYVSLVDPSPATFGKNHTVVFSNGEGETTVNVSAYSVLYLMHKGGDAEMVDLASSMYLLGKAADEYLNYYVQGNEPPKQAWDEDGVLKLLCIGNSFSVDAMEWVGEIAADLGYTEVVFGNLYIGGCYIDRHIKEIEGSLTNYTYYLETGTAEGGLAKVSTRAYLATDAIVSDNWDFISLQQGSARSYSEEHYANLPVLIDYVTSMCPNATLVWHQTWAYADWYANEKYNITQENMYNGILDCVQNSVMTNEEIKILVPSGTAIQNARTSYLGDTLNRDGTHLDYGVGRYIAALTFMAALTGADISEIEWAPTNIGEDVRDVDAAARAVAIESVINALKNPYEVTQSQYTQAPQE